MLRSTEHVHSAMDEQVVLYLGVKGSRSKLNYGVKASVKAGPINGVHYFDVSNIDHYDCVLGMPFLHAFHVDLLLHDRRIVVNGSHDIPVVTSEGGRAKDSTSKPDYKGKRKAIAPTRALHSFRVHNAIQTSHA